MDKQWARAFLDLPYLKGGTNSRGCDCRGLVQMVLDARMPSVRLPNGDNTEWHRVAAPQALDVVIMVQEVPTSAGVAFPPLHVGIMISHDQMLHIDDGRRSEAPYLQSPHIRGRVEEFWRHESQLASPVNDGAAS